MSPVHGVPAGTVLRFGVFELTPDSGELRKSGIPVRLTPQPARVLALLACRAGEVVTRDELREKLWQGETFVDFEAGLNHCINQIRTVLGDEAETPMYVETLRRRGYRFVAPVTRLRANAGKEEEAGAGKPEPPEEGKAGDAGVSRRLVWLLAATSVAGLGAAAVFAMLYREAARPELPLRRFAIVPTEYLHITSFNTDVVISPDGKKIAYRGVGFLHIQELERDEPRRIEGARIINDPFWSPDSRRVGLQQRQQLMVFPMDGGTPVRVCDLDGELWTGSWSPDGEEIAFTMGARPKLYLVRAKGGEPRLILDPSTGEHGADGPNGAVYAVRYLDAGRDSRILLFAAGPVGEPKLYVQDLKTGRRTGLGPGTLPWYSPSGHILYQESARSYSLWAMPFSLEKLAVTGKPFQVSARGRDPSVSKDGTLVYVETEPPGWRLAWRDREGRYTELSSEMYAFMQAPVLSGDQRYAAIAGGRDSSFSDLWVHDLVRGTRVRLTRAEEELYNTFAPAWSPDGGEVAYVVFGEGIGISRADGTGQREVVYRTPNFIPGLDWSRDGRRILYSIRNPGTGHDLYYLERSGPEGAWQARRFLAEQASEEFPRLSPDGRYAAYQSNVTGRPEVYVRSFPDGAREWAISSRGGRSPRWRQDGRELYYFDGTHALIAVSVRCGETLETGPEEWLFQLPERGPLVIVNYHYDAGAGGRRFLFAEPTGPNLPPRIRVVENWYTAFAGR